MDAIPTISLPSVGGISGSYETAPNINASGPDVITLPVGGEDTFTNSDPLGIQFSVDNPGFSDYILPGKGSLINTFEVDKPDKNSPKPGAIYPEVPIFEPGPSDSGSANNDTVFNSPVSLKPVTATSPSPSTANTSNSANTVKTAGNPGNASAQQVTLGQRLKTSIFNPLFLNFMASVYNQVYTGKGITEKAMQQLVTQWNKAHPDQAVTLNANDFKLMAAIGKDNTDGTINGKDIQLLGDILKMSQTNGIKLAQLNPLSKTEMDQLLKPININNPDLRKLLEMIGNTDQGKKVLELAIQNGLKEIVVNPNDPNFKQAPNTAAFFDPENNRIVLKKPPTVSENGSDTLVKLAHELLHAATKNNASSLFEEVNAERFGESVNAAYSGETPGDFYTYLYPRLASSVYSNLKMDNGIFSDLQKLFNWPTKMMNTIMGGNQSDKVDTNSFSPAFAIDVLSNKTSNTKLFEFNPSCPHCVALANQQATLQAA